MPARPEQRRPRGGELHTAGTPSPIRVTLAALRLLRCTQVDFFFPQAPFFMLFPSGFPRQALGSPELPPQPSPAACPEPTARLQGNRNPGVPVLEMEERCERLLYLCLVNNALVCTSRSLKTQGTVLYFCQAAELAAAPSAAAAGGRGTASPPPLGSFLPTNPAFYS